jgi:hypothetical protein
MKSRPRGLPFRDGPDTEEHSQIALHVIPKYRLQLHIAGPVKKNVGSGCSEGTTYTSNKDKRIFRYRLSLGTFGSALV